MKIRYLLWVVFPLFLVSCLTYYQRHLKFNRKFEAGQLQEAKSLLHKDKKAPRKNTELLYYLKNGHVEFLLDNYGESNEFFEKAYRYTEDYRKNYFRGAAAFLINPKVEPYKGEIHEILFINYYKALNYLKTGAFDKALVECKRMNNKLNFLSDKYKSDKKYQADAFIHMIMGMIYDANYDYNDAFIAYRNAWQIYQDDYQEMFGFGAPEQLKHDILRTAYLTGLDRELARFEETFKMDYQHEAEQGGELIFIWHNGMGPVKDEWSINFFLVRKQGGQLIFKNDKYGLSFPFYMAQDEYESKGLADVEVVRVAFPKYVERKPLFHKGILQANGKDYTMEKGEDINAIAFKSLNDRMLKELRDGLLRIALKKASEYQLRKQNENAGAVLGIINAITEQADTRNWQTLPYEIRYARVNLPAGDNTIKLKTEGNGSEIYEFNYTISKNKTKFTTFRSLNVQ